MRAMRFLPVIVALLPSIALAQPGGPEASSQSVALLPLDAGKTLELYGQPVASELARALASGNIDVQIVGPRMAVPAAARLIVDGTIKPGKGEAIELAIRVRNPADGTVLDTLSATASSLSNIDKAAADLASRVVPVIRARLAVLDQKPAVETPPPARPPQPPEQVAAPIVLSMSITGVESLRAPLAAGMEARAESTHHVLRDGAATKILLEVRDYETVAGAVPMARARVRLAIGMEFDRVLFTDTVVGEKGMAPEALAARVAQEVLVIARPYLKRVVTTWR
jgi:hypothetical protein